MLVPTFILYYKSRQSASNLETAISVAQQKRREDALRIMQLAENAPEKLTRAEKAVVEGKIAWRESVSSWRGSRTQSGSVQSGWSEGSGIKLGHLSKASTSSSGLRVTPDLEMAMPRPGSETHRDPSTLPVSTPVPGPAQPNTGKRQNAYDSLVGKRNPPVHEPGLNGLTAAATRTTGGANVSSHSRDHGSTSATADAAHRPTIMTDQQALDSHEGVSQDNLPTRSPNTQPTPTRLYGFHLPRPQAGQAYAMQPDGEMQQGVASHGPTPPPLGSASTRPPPPPLQSLETSSSEPIQLALRSPKRADASGNGVSRPAIVKHVSAPLTRRSAHIRRSTSASPIAIGKPKISTGSKRPRSRASSLSSARASRALQEDIAAVGPSWHRERMNKLSVSAEDLQRPT